MSEDEYELMPVKEIERLRKEIEMLKQNPFGEHPKGKTLLESIQELTKAINDLRKLFTDVEQEIIDDFEKTASFNTRFQELIDQNKKIAAGIVTIADMIKAEKIINNKQETSKEQENTNKTSNTIMNNNQNNNQEPNKTLNQETIQPPPNPIINNNQQEINNNMQGQVINNTMNNNQQATTANQVNTIPTNNSSSNPSTINNEFNNQLNNTLNNPFEQKTNNNTFFDQAQAPPFPQINQEQTFNQIPTPSQPVINNAAQGTNKLEDNNNFDLTEKKDKHKKGFLGLFGK